MRDKKTHIINLIIVVIIFLLVLMDGVFEHSLITVSIYLLLTIQQMGIVYYFKKKKEVKYTKMYIATSIISFMFFIRQCIVVWI